MEPNYLILNDPMLNGVVVKMAINRFRYVDQDRIDMDDLVQEARLGLILAAHALQDCTEITGKIVNYVKLYAKFQMSKHIIDFGYSCVAVPYRSYYRNVSSVEVCDIDVETLCNYNTPESNVVNKESNLFVVKFVNNFVKTLNKMEKKVFYYRIWSVSPKSLRRVGELTNSSHSWVKKIEDDVVTKFKKLAGGV